LGSQNVLELNEPVLIEGPDDGQIGPKHVALNELLIVIIDVKKKKINTVYKSLGKLMSFGRHKLEGILRLEMSGLNHLLYYRDNDRQQ
jgi:hypothetical protein